jgi:hypothetical protein
MQGEQVLKVLVVMQGEQEVVLLWLRLIVGVGITTWLGTSYNNAKPV